MVAAACLLGPMAVLLLGLSPGVPWPGTHARQIRAAAGRLPAHGRSIQVLHPVIPLPASAQVAVAYLTLRNNGGSPDALLGGTSSMATSVMLHSEVSRGQVEQMVPVPRAPIPAHGRLRLAPGHYHLMLRGLTSPLRVGQLVPISLRFAHAPAMALSVPVVPMARAFDPHGAGAVMAGMGGNGGMGGMG